LQRQAPQAPSWQAVQKNVLPGGGGGGKKKTTKEKKKKKTNKKTKTKNKKKKKNKKRQGFAKSKGRMSPRGGRIGVGDTCCTSLGKKKRTSFPKKRRIGTNSRGNGKKFGVRKRTKGGRKGSLNQRQNRGGTKKKRSKRFTTNS